jgi:hypothetical protein
MSFETKEEVFERVMALEKPLCPHCQQEMNLWEIPPIAVGDGLGWGTPYLYVCFNDDCNLYRNGWENIRENFSHHASYRCMNYPGTSNFECIPVFGPDGGKGQILDDEVLVKEAMLKEAVKRGFAILADCYRTQNWVELLKMVIDPTEPARVRLKAADMLGDFGEVEALETLKNTRFGSVPLQAMADQTVSRIQERLFVRECPFCAEIIKKRAKVCKHCNKEVAGA